MRGKIKFVDGKTGKWGFIVPDDGSADVHFSVTDFAGPQPLAQDAGAAVEFTLAEQASGPHHHVQSAQLVDVPVRRHATEQAAESLGQALTNWSFFPLSIGFTTPAGREYLSALEYLADLALDESWHFGDAPDSRDPFPILSNYVKYTFHKLQNDKQVFECETHAAFNTGLVDRLYDPIYALFVRNNRPSPPWKLQDFCVPGTGPSGKQLTESFSPLPEPASYFSSNFDMLLDTSQKIHVDYEHVIHDGVTRDRLPHKFLAQNAPRNFDFRDYRQMSDPERVAFLKSLSNAIRDDVQCTRFIKNRLEDAKSLAEKRVRWNFKTAIPQYHPRMNAMSLLLPLALVNDEEVDISLVVTRNKSGSYQGRTILSLKLAYMNARLVCRPDSDWLVPGLVAEDDKVQDDDF